MTGGKNMATSGNADFSLVVHSFHVFKRQSREPKVDLYTIGIWEGTVQRALCHDACLDCALKAIRCEIEKRGQDMLLPLDPNDTSKPAWHIEYTTTVHASSEEEAMHLAGHDVARGNCVARARKY
jgi:hypothetical protein